MHNTGDPFADRRDGSGERNTAAGSNSAAEVWLKLCSVAACLIQCLTCGTSCLMSAAECTTLHAFMNNQSRLSEKWPRLHGFFCHACLSYFCSSDSLLNLLTYFDGDVQAAPQPDLRDKLRKKRKAEQTSRPEPPVVKQGMPSRHLKSQQPSGHAPRHWP